MKIFFLLFFCGLLCAATLKAQNVASGTTGTCTWTLTGSPNDYTLTISGAGAMPNYDATIQPWYSYRESIKTVVISQEVTAIGTYAFSNCTNLKKVSIEDGTFNLNFGTTLSPNFGVGYIPNAFTNCPLEILHLGRNIAYNGVNPELGSIANSPFSRNNGLTSLTIGNTVTSLGNYLFINCGSLTEVTIPNSVISIGGSAFNGCSNLSKVTIPNSVTVIGVAAFSGCTSLSKVTIPNTVTTIYDNTFYNCSSLTEIIIPSSITTIGSSAFYGCINLKEIIIPNSITTIGGSAFSGCSGLKALTIQDGTSPLNVGSSSAFAGCPVETLYWGRNLTGSIAPFSNNTKLTTLTISELVTSIGASAFSGCSGLTTVTIPNSVTSIGAYAFSGCSGLTGTLIIPDKITTIQSNTFKGCSGLTGLIIPNSVTSIDDNAFSGCVNLLSIEIKNPIPPTVIANTFSTNPVITRVYVPHESMYEYYKKDVWKGMQLIGKDDTDALYCLTLLHVEEGEPVITVNGTDDEAIISKMDDGITVTVKEGKTDYHVIVNGNNVTDFLEYNPVQSFPSRNINHIYTYRIADQQRKVIPVVPPGELINILNIDELDNIRELTLSSDLNGTDILMIRRMNNLIVLNMKYASIVNGGMSYYGTYITSANQMGAYFFTDKTKLSIITLPDNVTGIGANTFQGCVNLKYIHIPPSVTSIGASAFSGCTTLACVNIDDSPNGLQIASNTFTNCPVNALHMGRTLTAYPFYSSTTLTTITVGDLVKVIGSDFSSCTGISALTLGQEVNSIATNAFTNCRGLFEINCKSPLPPETVASAFTNVSKDRCILYVPLGSRNLYRIHPPWDSFNPNIIERDFLASDAKLKNLTVLPGRLDPVFQMYEKQYKVTLDSEITSIIIGAEATHPAADISGAGTLNLTASKTERNVVVTSADKKHQEKYTIVIVREGVEPGNNNNDATLSSLEVSPGTLTPIFNSNIVDYSVRVPNEVTSITIKATPADPNAKKVDGTGSKSLVVGDNNFYILVTAEDGKTTKTYTIIVTRNGVVSSNDASLAGLTVNSKAASLKMGSTNTYSITIDYTQNINIVATPNSNKANVSGQTGNQNVTVGLNTFTLKITAEDGTFTDYTLEVTVNDQNIPSNDASLYLLTVNGKVAELKTGSTDTYFITIEHTQIISIMVMPNSDKTSVTGQTGNQNVIVGLNTFAFRVTAENKTYINYRLEVTVNAQQQATGNVTVSGTVAGAPAGTTVQLYGAPAGTTKSSVPAGYSYVSSTTTNGAGYYIFDHLPPGVYIVIVVMNGNESQPSNPVSLANGETAGNVNFTVKGDTVTPDGITGVETWRAASLQIYPNPFTDVVRITSLTPNPSPKERGQYVLQIVNEAGAVVHTQTITSADETIRLEHLPAGVYFFVIENEKESKTIKTVKE